MVTSSDAANDSIGRAAASSPLHFTRSVVIKALLLFLVLNLIFGLANPAAAFGRISAYNRLFPGRTRLPYGDDPQRAYNLSLFNLEAMFNSHEITAGPKPPDEFRVILIGDSSTWGFLLEPDQTPAAYLNASRDRLSDGRVVRYYNLGYPVMSLTKDLLILSYALRYEPDLIVWPLTLESFPYDKQLFPPLLQNNAAAVRRLIAAHHLVLDPEDPQLKDASFWEKTIVGQRRDLADLLRLQLYGVLWAATGRDQYIPEDFTPRMEDLPADESFHNLQPPKLRKEDLALDVLRAGLELAGDIPVVLVNEPMFISQGENSDLRYNFFYPRWAYDDYRELMAAESSASGWRWVDLWQAVPAGEFTNSAVHTTPQGARIYAQALREVVLDLAADVVGHP